MGNFELKTYPSNFEINKEALKPTIATASELTLDPKPKVETPKPAPAAAPSAPKPVVAGFKVKSPLPGSVLKVVVAEGQAVKRGDVLLTLESMKMENNILAEKDGVVKSIAVTTGQSVMQDDLLLIMD